MPSAAEHYTDLRTASEIARYGTVNQFNRQYPGDTVQRVLIDGQLATIEKYVSQHFAPPPPSPSK